MVRGGNHQNDPIDGGCAFMLYSKTSSPCDGARQKGDGSLKTEAAQPMRPMVSDKRFMAAG